MNIQIILQSIIIITSILVIIATITTGYTSVLMQITWMGVTIVEAISIIIMSKRLEN
jgi:hypothetical protein